MNTKQEKTELLSGSIASLRVVIRFALKEIVEQKEAHLLDSSEFAQMFVDVISDRTLVKDVAFFQVVKQEMLRLDVISVYGAEQGRLTENLQRTLETFRMLMNYEYAAALRNFEETVQKGYVELWDADTQSRLLEESLVLEIVEDSFYQDVETVRRAIRSGDLSVIQSSEMYRSLGYEMDDARKHYSVLSNGMIVHYNHDGN